MLFQLRIDGKRVGLPMVLSEAVKWEGVLLSLQRRFPDSQIRWRKVN